MIIIITTFAQKLQLLHHSMSTIFKHVKNRINYVIGKERTTEEIQEEEEQLVRQERRRKQLMDKIRAKFLSKGLIGSISLSNSLFNTEYSVSCDVTESDYVKAALDAIDVDSLDSIKDDNSTKTVTPVPISKQEAEDEGSIVKLTLYYADFLISRLEYRAKSYQRIPYRDSMTLTCSHSLTGPLGFASISLCLTATIASLLDSSKSTSS